MRLAQEQADIEYLNDVTNVPVTGLMMGDGYPSREEERCRLERERREWEQRECMWRGHIQCND